MRNTATNADRWGKGARYRNGDSASRVPTSIRLRVSLTEILLMKALAGTLQTYARGPANNGWPSQRKMAANALLRLIG